MNIKNKQIKLLAAISIGSLLLFSQFSFAVVTLEEVIVTAQKRAQNLQDTPLAVTAFDSEYLEDAGIEEITEIAQRTPGLSIAAFNLGQPQIYIRGIGSNEDSPGGDPSVVVFLDEVYLGRPAGSAFELFDLERIEVLRGPQGTLYGKNASGGAINITTRKPNHEFTAKARVGYGNLDNKTVRGYVSSGLTENVAGSLSFSYNERDGYVESVVTGTDLQDRDSIGVRSSFLFTPSNDIEVLWSADYSRDDNLSSGRKLLGGATGTNGIATAVEAVFPGVNADHFSTASDVDGFEDRDIWGTSLRINWDTSFGELTSITAYRESSFDQLTNITGNTVAGTGTYILNGVDEDADQISQEIRLSNTGDGLLAHWVVGFYYIQEDATRREDFVLFANPPRSVTMSNETTSIAAFGEVSLALSEQFQLTFGARYTRDEKDFDAVGVFTATPGIVIMENFNTSDSESWSEPTYKVTLDYKPVDDWLLYATYSTGFKSGGYQGQPGNAFAATTPFDPETADHFELGAKMTLFDKVRANLSLFHTSYEDYQELLTVTDEMGLPRTITTNAAEVETKGVEAELLWVPIENLEFSATGSWLSAKYEAYTDFPNRVGNRTRNAPKNSYTAGVAYELPLGDTSSLDFRMDYRYQNTAFQDPDNLAFAAIPSYGLLDGRITYNYNDKISLTFWGKNLADEEYLAHNFPLIGAGATISGLPRTYGVSVDWEY